MKPQKNFQRFVKSITNEDKVALIHHMDADGVCSAVITARALEKLTGKLPKPIIDLSVSKLMDLDGIIHELREEEVTKIIVVDLAFDQNKQAVKELESFAELLILDHHKIYSELNSKRTVFIKPQMIGNKIGHKYPASKLCYDLFSELVDLSELDWVAVIGLYGDCSEKAWKSFVQKTAKKHKLKSDVVLRISKIVDYSTELLQADEVFDILYSTKDPKEILVSKLSKASKKIEAEVNHYVNNWEKLAEVHKKVIFLSITSKYKTHSAIINSLSQKYPKKLFISWSERSDDIIRISGRCQQGLAVNDLLEKAVKGLEGASAGGHKPAAGAQIQKKDLDEFKKRILKQL